MRFKAFFYLFFSLALPYALGAEEMAPSLELDPGDFKISFFKTLAVIAFCLVLIFLALWFFKRFANQKFFSLNEAHHIKIIEKRPISPKSILYLIQVGDRQIVIAESQLEVRALQEILPK